MPLNTIYVLTFLFVFLHVHIYHYHKPIFTITEIAWDRGTTKQKPGNNKKKLFIALGEVILQQANNTDNIYYCILETRAIFTETVDETSAAGAEIMFVSSQRKDSH